MWLRLSSIFTSLLHFLFPSFPLSLFTWFLFLHFLLRSSFPFFFFTSSFLPSSLCFYSFPPLFTSLFISSSFHSSIPLSITFLHRSFFALSSTHTNSYYLLSLSRFFILNHFFVIPFFWTIQSYPYFYSISLFLLSLWSSCYSLSVLCLAIHAPSLWVVAEVSRSRAPRCNKLAAAASEAQN